MLKVNRCLDLCSGAPQITPNQQLAVFVTGLFLVVNFLPKRSRISSGTLVRGCGETCSQLPGHCVSTHIWGGGAVVKVRGQQTPAKIMWRVWRARMTCFLLLVVLL